MSGLRWGWIGAACLASVPYLVLFAAGSIWLYQYHMLWAWFLLALGCTLAACPWVVWLRRRSLARADRLAGPGEHWPPAAQDPWQQIDAMARRLQGADLPLDRFEPWWAALLDVIRVVAGHYHPGSKRPELEVPLPHVLRIAELVAADLRKALAENVPGAHLLTLHDFTRFGRWAAWARRLYFFYRVIQLPINPLAAAIREVRDFSTDKLTDASAQDVKRWAVGFCVRRAGYYAVELYGGKLLLEPDALRDYQTPQTRRDINKAGRRGKDLAAEPLRILVAGQVKSGKSSLINALFGALEAATDVLPCTRGVDPYVLRREGWPQALILDTAGYADVESADAGFTLLDRETLHCDAVLLVVSALSAARAADRRWLDQFRASLAASPERIPPPIVVVLSHVDQVRPWSEWNPPYDLRGPAEGKAGQIASAIEATAADLAVPSEAIVPACLHPERLYNVAEALIPALARQLPEAQRARYLRCLREYHDEQYWRQLWQQTLSAGRLLLGAGADWLKRRQGD